MAIRAEPRAKHPSSGVGDSYRDALRKFVLDGWIPDRPPLDREGLTITQGSCFAEHISTALNESGIKSTYIKFTEIANSPMANALYFEYGLKGKKYETAEHKISFAPEKMDALRDTIQTAATFIFTMGVAMVPVRGGHLVLHGAAAADVGWRFTDVAENVGYVTSIINNLRASNPKIKIILTVSPIPLVRGQGSKSAMTDDCLSKSILRVAVAEVMAANHPGVYYWPSFEAIRWLGGHMGPIFGSEGSDQRHPGPSYVTAITEEFIRAFYG